LSIIVTYFQAFSFAGRYSHFVICNVTLWVCSVSNSSRDAASMTWLSAYSIVLLFLSGAWCIV